MATVPPISKDWEDKRIKCWVTGNPKQGVRKVISHPKIPYPTHEDWFFLSIFGHWWTPTRHLVLEPRVIRPRGRKEKEDRGCQKSNWFPSLLKEVPVIWNGLIYFLTSKEEQVSFGVTPSPGPYGAEKLEPKREWDLSLWQRIKVAKRGDTETR